MTLIIRFNDFQRYKMLLSTNRKWKTWKANDYANYIHGFDCFLKYLYMAN